MLGIGILVLVRGVVVAGLRAAIAIAAAVALNTYVELSGFLSTLSWIAAIAFAVWQLVGLGIFFYVLSKAADINAKAALFQSRPSPPPRRVRGRKLR